MTENFEVGDVPKDGVNWALFRRFFVFFVVAGALFSIFLWVVFLKSVRTDVSLQPSVSASQGDFEIGDYTVDSDYQVYFDQVDLMRFTAGSEFTVDDISENNGFYTVAVTLVKGGVWVANMGGVLDLKLKSGDFMFQNVDGYYYVENDLKKVFAYSYRHPCEVYFLDEKGSSLNSYLLPEGYYVDFAADSVSDVVGDLRYAKLVKDYPFYALSSSQERDFIDGYAKEDDDRYRKILFDFEALVLDNYGSFESEGFAAKVENGVDFLRDKLTFSQVKKDENVEQDTLKSLNKALYLSVSGDPDGAVSVLNQIEQGSVKNDSYVAYLSYLNVVLNNSVYGDDLYPVKNYLRDLLYSGEGEDGIIVLRERLNEIYDLVNAGDVALAKDAFSDYERGWWDFLGMSADELSAYRQDISEERELLSVLLLDTEGFYSTDYFELLESFEDAIFKVAVSGTDLDEERQSFVSSKVKALNKIESLVSSNDLSVDSATDLMIMLLESADVLMGEIESDAAVLTYFQSEIDHSWIVVQFINSVEYSSLSGTFDEKLDAYMQKTQDVEELKNYLQGLHLGADSGGDLTLDEAKAVVEDALDGAGISYSSVSSVGDGAYRLFSVDGASLDGVDFEAKYDRESSLIYDLVVGDVKFSTGVRLEDLGGVISGLQAGGGEEEVESGSGEVSSSSSEEFTYSEQVAIGLLEDYLAQYDITISDSNIVDVDVENDVFTLTGVEVGEEVLDFVIYLETGQVSGVDGVETVGDLVDSR